MSEQDFQSLLDAFDEIDRDVTTAQQARDMLIAEGYLEEDGTVAEIYAESVD